MGSAARGRPVARPSDSRSATPSTPTAWSRSWRSSKRWPRASTSKRRGSRSSPTSPARCSAPEQATSPSYWASQIREPVRFADGIASLSSLGVGTYLELGPEAVLCALAAETLSDSETQPSFAAALRRERPEPQSAIALIGAAHANGAEVDFSALFKDSGASTVELPTYPFQRQRYWLEASPGKGDAGALGQSGAEHPFLGASIALASEGQHLLTGRISQRTHPWLADHAVAGTPILPGVAFAELALRAGTEVGAQHLDELILQAPMPIPETGALQIQIAIAPSEGESFEVAIHSRPEPGDSDDATEGEWTQHAQGTLTTETPSAPDFDATTWPPPGAEPIDSDGLYDLAAEIGLEYGPAFQGLGDAWRSGEEIFAEVSLASEQEDEAGRFGVHPALLDAALHPLLLRLSIHRRGAEPPLQLHGPCSSRGGRRHRPAGQAPDRRRAHLPAGRGPGRSSALLDLLDRHQGGRSRSAAGSAGLLLGLPLRDRVGGAGAARRGSSGASRLAPAPPSCWPSTQRHRLRPSSSTASPPRLDQEPASETQARTAEGLALVQAFLSNERLAESRLAILTEGNLAGGESPDLPTAALWGLIRSAQSEHPGRLILIDSDGSEASEAALAAALSIEDEPQLALREGRPMAPRLAPLEDRGSEAAAPDLDPEGTVLITGGLSGLGALTARHLAETHGARHLLLLSRRGEESPGATELIGRARRARLRGNSRQVRRIGSRPARRADRPDPRRASAHRDLPLAPASSTTA